MNAVPDHLYHYYDLEAGPFRSLSDLSVDRAEEVLDRLRGRGDHFASQRDRRYLTVRRELETRARLLFRSRGGRPVRTWPHTLTLGECSWLLSWYPTPAVVSLPLSSLDASRVCFTYGDLFPAMRHDPGHPTTGRIYLLDELEELVGVHGLPQHVNPNGERGPKRYIEAQLWDDPPR